MIWGAPNNPSRLIAIVTAKIINAPGWFSSNTGCLAALSVDNDGMTHAAK
jgi:hypothetical protein